MARAHLPADERVTTPLWRNVSFQLMWTSVAASGFGDRVMMLAAMTLLGATSPDAQGTSIVAGLNFFFFLPYLVLGAPAGWLADRLPRKWLMLTCDESRAVILLTAFLLVPAAGVAIIPPDHHWKVFAVILSVGIFAGIFSPVRNAVVPQIVPLKHLQSANALLIGIAVIANLIGMIVGGFMIDPDQASSVRTGLGVGCAFFGVSGTFFAFLKIRPSRAIAAGQSSRRPFSRKGEAGALPYIMRHRMILTLIVISMVVWGAAFVVLNAAMALSRLQYGIDPNDQQQILQAYTFMLGAIGLGMLLGAVWVAWMNTRRESGAIGMLALGLAAVCTAGLAVTPVYWLGVLFAFGVGFFGNTTIICITTLLQSITPNYILGRVMGINSLTSTASNIAINFVFWRIADADNVILRTLQVLAVVLAMVAAAGLWMETTRGPIYSKTLNVIWRLSRAYALVWHRVRWIGKHRVPHEGPVILAPNHTTGLDPILIQAGCNRLVRWVMLTTHRYRALEFLWKRLKPVFLDLDQRDTSRIREILAILEQGQVVALFPEGGLQREHRDLQPFQPGLGLIARKSQAPIVPIWIDGTPRKHRMFWHFATPSHSTVIFGEPYKADPTWSNEQIVQDLRRRMLELAAMTRQSPESHVVSS